MKKSEPESAVAALENILRAALAPGSDLRTGCKLFHEAFQASPRGAYPESVAETLLDLDWGMAYYQPDPELRKTSPGTIGDWEPRHLIETGLAQLAAVKAGAK